MQEGALTLQITNFLIKLNFLNKINKKIAQSNAQIIVMCLCAKCG